MSCIGTNKTFFVLPTTDKKILDFLDLPQRWHYGEGVAPSEQTVENAILMNNHAILLGLKTEAFPGIDGEIQINCYFGNKTLEFMIESSGEISLVEEENDIEISSDENLTIKKALDFLREYGNKIWNLSEQSTHVTTANTEEDLRVWRSQIPPTGVEYQLSPAVA
ncbi:MAG: hypothetical protein KAI59_06585 [Planctomycetes bacterium]|nr:hypothetical protein [Planctomycetota bacterium]MCK5473683.1 hypothetical protein [Planctomycetota bacterium]